MKFINMLSAASIAMVIVAPAAFAFKTDDQSMGSAASSANFSDPDNKTPVYMNEKGANNGSSDPSAMHYEYDTTSGVYVPVTSKQ